MANELKYVPLTDEEQKRLNDAQSISIPAGWQGPLWNEKPVQANQNPQSTNIPSARRIANLLYHVVLRSVANGFYETIAVEADEVRKLADEDGWEFVRLEGDTRIRVAFFSTQDLRYWKVVDRPDTSVYHP